ARRAPVGLRRPAGRELPRVPPQHREPPALPPPAEGCGRDRGHRRLVGGALAGPPAHPPGYPGPRGPAPPRVPDHARRPRPAAARGPRTTELLRRVIPGTVRSRLPGPERPERGGLQFACQPSPETVVV